MMRSMTALNISGSVIILISAVSMPKAARILEVRRPGEHHRHRVFRHFLDDLAALHRIDVLLGIRPVEVIDALRVFVILKDPGAVSVRSS